MTKVIETVTNFHVMFGHILYAMTLSVTIIVVAVPDDCSSKGLREKIRVNKLSLRKTVNYCFLFSTCIVIETELRRKYEKYR